MWASILPLSTTSIPAMHVVSREPRQFGCRREPNKGAMQCSYMYMYVHAHAHVQVHVYLQCTQCVHVHSKVNKYLGVDQEGRFGRRLWQCIYILYVGRNGWKWTSMDWLGINITNLWHTCMQCLLSKTVTIPAQREGGGGRGRASQDSNLTN